MSRRKTKDTPAYQLVSNLKDKPNAQGTLFSGGQLSDTRWPKGYSPDRMTETQKHFTALDTPFRGHMQKNYPGSYEQVLDRTMQNYARSTIDFGATPPVGLELTQNKPGFSGDYLHPGASKTGQGRIRIPASKAETYIPTHEHGHHDDRQRVASLGYQDDTRRGQTEGYADQYAENNFRTRAGKTIGIKPTPQGWYRGYQISTPGRQQNFSSGYMAGRREGGYQVQQAAGSNFEQGTLF
jgi:hypothetical protein